MFLESAAQSKTAKSFTQNNLNGEMKSWCGKKEGNKKGTKLHFKVYLWNVSMGGGANFKY